MNEALGAIIRMRLQQADEALATTRVLLTAPVEAGRAVVNRAYYAAFYALLALLQHANLAPRKHANAIALFDREFVRTNAFDKECSKWLRKLFDMRMMDDYESLEPVPREEAELAVSMSEQFVEAVKKYLANQIDLNDSEA